MAREIKIGSGAPTFQSGVIQRVLSKLDRPVLRKDPVTFGDLDALAVVLEEVMTENFTVVESTLNTFHQGIIRGERQMNGLWNTMNVFVSILLKKRVVEETEVIEEGKSLFEQAKETFDAIRAAVQKGKKPPETLKRTPLEAIIATLGEINKANSALKDPN